MRMVSIDKRPTVFLFAERYKKFIALVSLFLLFGTAVGHIPEGISKEGARAIWVFLLCGALWATNLIPPAITGLVAIVLIPILGILPPKKTYALFGNEPVFFILSAFIISLAMERSQLSRRITLYFLSFGGNSEKKLAFSLYLLGAVLSFFMPEHAVAVLLFPVVREISATLGLKERRSNFGRLLFLSLAWGTIIGGIATFLGGARNALAVGLLEEIGGQRIGFIEWIRYSGPLVGFLFISGFAVLFLFFKPEKVSIEAARDTLKREFAQLPPFTFKELLVGFIVSGTIAGWTLVGHGGVGLAAVALVSAILFFVLGIIEWSDAEKKLDWGTIFMYGGAITLGSAFSQTDASHYLIAVFFQKEIAPFKLAFVAGFAAIVLTEFMSNAAVVALLLPLILKIGVAAHHDIKLLTASVALMSGLAFTLPVGTPSHAVAYSAGYYSVWDSVKAGIIMNVFALAGLWACVRYIW